MHNSFSVGALSQGKDSPNLSTVTPVQEGF
jgi:hypothetical protein